MPIRVLRGAFGTAAIRSPASVFFVWNILSVATVSVSAIVIARALGPSGRGDVVLLVATAGLAALFASCGLNLGYRANYPRGKVSFGALVVSLVPVTVFSLLLAAVVRFALRGTASSLSDVGVFLGFGVLLWSSAVSLILLDALKSHGKLGTSGFVDFCGASVTTLAALSLVWAGCPITVFVGVALYALGQAVRCFLSLAILIVGRRHEEALSSGGVFSTVGNLWSSGLGFMIFGVAQQLVFTLDSVVGGLVVGAHALGIYSAAASVAALLRLPATALGHEAAHKVALGEGSEVVVRRLLIAVLVTAMASVPVMAMSSWIIEALFGAAFGDASRVLCILAVAQVVLAPYLVLSRALVGSGHGKELSACSILSVIVLVAGLIVFGAKWQAEGIGLAVLVCSTGMSLWVYFRWRKLSWSSPTLRVDALSGG